MMYSMQKYLGIFNFVDQITLTNAYKIIILEFILLMINIDATDLKLPLTMCRQIWLSAQAQ